MELISEERLLQYLWYDGAFFRGCGTGDYSLGKWVKVLIFVNGVEYKQNWIKNYIYSPESNSTISNSCL